jgi:hypothetical protein
MISLALPSLKIMTVLGTCNSSPICCNRFLLLKKLFDSFQIPDGYRYIDSKSKELDDVVIREQEDNTLREQADAKLADLEKKIVAVEGEKKDQGLLLETAQQALSKHEDSSILMILTAVANAMALLKSHLPNLNVELLCKDFAVDEADHEALTIGAYDAAHEFASSYDFSKLADRGLLLLRVKRYFGVKGPPIRSPLLFVCGAAHVKSIS